MNEIWHFLREFESKELVKRFIKKKHSYTLNDAKASEITSAFTQGREYFNSYTQADISVKPLLQYYGIVALSRGLILILNKDARENNIKPAHGLKINNWSVVAQSGKIEDVVLKSSGGTFTELIGVTGNKSYFRSATDAINWQVSYNVPPQEVEFSLKDICLCFPDLNQSVASWLDIEVPSRPMVAFRYIDDNSRIEIELRGKTDRDVADQMFPPRIFEELEFVAQDHKAFVRFKNTSQSFPNFAQKWVSTFQVIGDAYVTPPFQNNVILNDIAKMYAASFVLGTISRYYPTTWGSIHKGIRSDSILPFAINLMDFLQDKYPKITMDFIKSPYDFEKRE